MMGRPQPSWPEPPVQSLGSLCVHFEGDHASYLRMWIPMISQVEMKIVGLLWSPPVQGFLWRQTCFTSGMGRWFVFWVDLFG
jgi:hypothetical protein